MNGSKRSLLLWGAALALLVVPACVGGSGGVTTTGAAALQGVVYERDGQSSDLDGVTITLVETGAAAWTEADGSFRIDGVEPGVYTIDVRDERSPDSDADEHHGDEDEFHDGEGRPRIEVPEDCGRIEVRIALEGGEIVDFCASNHEERRAVARLHLAEHVEMEIAGKILVASGPEGEHLAVCVEGLEAGTLLEVRIGGMVAGSAETGADGEACFVNDTGEGDVLLGGTTLDLLVGARVEVRLAASGELLLVGEVPRLPEETDEPDEDGNDHDGDGMEDGPDRDEPGDGDSHEPGMEGDEPREDDGAAEPGEGEEPCADDDAPDGGSGGVLP